MKKCKKLSVVMIVFCLASVVSAGPIIGDPDAGNGWSTTSAVTATGSQYNGTGSFGYGTDYLVNGAGLNAATGTKHDLNFGLWGADEDTGAANNPGTAPGGTVWVLFEFDQVYELGHMWVWNFNHSGALPNGSGCRRWGRPRY